MSENLIVSFSGGKDSTAMLHMLLDRGEPIHSVVWFDTGWEFPRMIEHIAEVEKQTGIDIVRLEPDPSFDYLMYEHPVVARRGPQKGFVKWIGHGWPSPMRRWCTREKGEALRQYGRSVIDSVMCIGFAYDELQRLNTVAASRGQKRYPLIEWQVTEAEALAYCNRLGYAWGGLYDRFDRVSCFCCPLQGLNNLRTLRQRFPVLWQRMLDMDERIQNNRGFNHDATVHDLDRRFAEEQRQVRLEAKCDSRPR